VAENGIGDESANDDAADLLLVKRRRRTETAPAPATTTTTAMWMVTRSVDERIGQ
jgi:hypothetical protein